MGCPENDGDADVSFFRPGPIGGGGFISLSNVNDGVPDDGTFTYLAKADAAFGALHVFASGNYSLPGPVVPTNIRDAFAFAVATDQLTLTSPGRSGLASLNVSFKMDGSVQKTGGGGAAVLAYVTAGQSLDAFDNPGNGFDGLTSFNVPLTVSVPFTWGQPFFLSMISVVAAGTPVSCLACVDGDANSTPTSGTGSGSADFFSTMQLTGLVPIVGGAPVLNTQFTSSSGTTYNTTGVVPEPATLLLVGTGVAAAVRRRRRAQSK